MCKGVCKGVRDGVRLLAAAAILPFCGGQVAGQDRDALSEEVRST